MGQRWTPMPIPTDELLSQVWPLLLLLPGFITFFVERGLAQQEDCQGIELVAKSLVYSLLSFMIMLGLAALGYEPNLLSWQREGDIFTIRPEPSGLFTFAGAAFILGVIIGVLKKCDVLPLQISCNSNSKSPSK